MKLHVFTISTGVYNGFIEYQIKSLNNIYPGVEKTWNIISDKEYKLNLNEYPEYSESNYYHITNLPYPFITYFKTQYICDMIKLHNFSNDDLFIFCDIDSYFLNKGSDYYKYIFDNDKIHFAISPHMDNDTWDIVDTETKNNEISCSYFGKFNKETFKKYSQGSFIFGKINQLFELNSSIMNMISVDCRSYAEIGYIATMNDQSLFNKYIFDNDDKIITDYYISNSYDWNPNDDSTGIFWGNPGYDKHVDTVFCVQKFLRSIKKSKRYVNSFKNEI